VQVYADVPGPAMGCWTKGALNELSGITICSYFRIAMPTSQTDALCTALRRALKQHGIRQVDAAQHCGVGVASIKRWLAGRGLTLDRLEQLAGLAGLTLADLAEAAAASPPELALALTLAQEKALSEDDLLSFVFVVTLGGEPWQDIVDDFGVPPAQVATALARLEKLALIDRLPSGRVRARVVRNIIWRKAPMRAQFEARMKPQFMAMDFAAPESIYTSDIYKLSDRGVAMLAELLEQQRRELQALAESDRRGSVLQRRWHAVLSAARPLDSYSLRQTLSRAQN